MNDDKQQYFEYVGDVVQELHDLFVKHEALVEEYSRAMEYINLRGWREDYVQHVLDDDIVEGNDDGQRGD